MKAVARHRFAARTRQYFEKNRNEPPPCEQNRYLFFFQKLRFSPVFIGFYACCRSRPIGEAVRHGGLPGHEFRRGRQHRPGGRRDLERQDLDIEGSRRRNTHPGAAGHREASPWRLGAVARSH